MKRISLIACLFLIVTSIPAYSSDKFVIDFRNEKPVPRGELVNLIDLIEQRNPRYADQRIVNIKVYANSRNRSFGGYVQLLDDSGRVISEDTLSTGYISLPVYEEYQRAAFLRFENDVYLKRIEVVTDRQLRALKQKEVMMPRRALEIGNFVKANYKPEVKKFSIPHGGFSKINFRVHVGEQHAVIVNSILVLSNAKKIGWKTVGARLSNGDNEFSIDVPDGATDIQVSFAHGQGSSVQVLLQP